MAAWLSRYGPIVCIAGAGAFAFGVLLGLVCTVWMSFQDCESSPILFLLVRISVLLTFGLGGLGAILGGAAIASALVPMKHREVTASAGIATLPLLLVGLAMCLAVAGTFEYGTFEALTQPPQNVCDDGSTSDA